MSAKYSKLGNACGYDSEDNLIAAQRSVSPTERAFRLRVVIGDDHPVVRDAIRTLLTLEEDIEVVGEASNGYEVIKFAYKIHPDLVILDLHMPRMDGIAALEALQQMDIKPKVIIFTAAEHRGAFVKAMKLGCAGIVLKESAPELIVNCIRAVVAGEMWFFITRQPRLGSSPTTPYRRVPQARRLTASSHR
jgi:DNA-binding NarL/FixJ family response regulator